MELRERNQFYVLGMRLTCSENELNEEMPKLWQEFRKRINEIENRINDYVLDICLYKINKEYTQLVGVEVRDLSHIPEGMIGITIPHERYVYCRYSGAEDDICKTFGSMEQWIRKMGYTQDPYDFKIDYCPQNNGSAHELYLKVV